MGNTGTVAVLVGVGVLVALLVMWGFIDIPFLHRQEPNQWRIDISAATEGGTVDNIQALASVNPRGITFVDANVPLQVNASDFAGWAFSYWLFDNATYGETPYVVVPAQAPNSTHTLVAVFEPKVPTFEIMPNKTFTKGASGEVVLTIKNNENVELTSVYLKLNDPYGVFSTCNIFTRWHSSSGNWQRTWRTCLNQYSSEKISFTINDYGINNYNMVPLSQNSIGIQYGISSSIPAGTYNLTWEIQFTVSSGSFSEPPELTIPWQVTILG